MWWSFSQPTKQERVLDEHGNNALIILIEKETDEEFIINYINSTNSVDINHVNKYGSTPLLVAITNNYSLNLINHLINSKTNIDHIGANGLTALMLAIEYSRSKDIINKLLEYGANINIKIPYDNNTYLQKLLSMYYSEWHWWSFLSKEPIDKLIETVKAYNGGMYIYLKNINNTTLSDIEKQELIETGELFLNTQHSIMKAGEMSSKNRTIRMHTSSCNRL